MIAEQILFSQGFGTRHECTGLIVQGRFHVIGIAVTDPDEDIPTDNLTFEVDGKRGVIGEALVSIDIGFFRGGSNRRR